MPLVYMHLHEVLLLLSFRLRILTENARRFIDSVAIRHGHLFSGLFTIKLPHFDDCIINWVRKNAIMTEDFFNTIEKYGCIT